MTESSLSVPQAELKAALWQVQAGSIDNSDLYVWLLNSDLPPEISARLHELVTYTKKVGDKLLEVGKIILIKIIEFIEAHPHLSMGIALGVAVGVLVNSVPMLGPILSPLATALGIIIGGVAGHRLDRGYQDKELTIVGVAQDLIEIAMEFFSLVIDVFNIIFRCVIFA